MHRFVKTFPAMPWHMLSAFLFVLPALLVLLALPGTSARAHEVRPAIADIAITADGALHADIRLNLEALLAGIGPQHKNTQDSPNAAQYDALRKLPPAELRQRFEQRRAEIIKAIELKVDGKPVHLVFKGLEIPPVGNLAVARTSVLKLAARLPLPAQAFTWRWPRDYGDIVLRVALEKGRQGNAQAIDGGVDGGTPAYIYAGLVRGGEESPPISLKEVQPPSQWDVFSRYIVIGFEHILPKGTDHILFVVGLFLLSASIPSLLWQISSFTLAHTITLGLAMAGYISAPSSIVEPLIAASIVYVAVENIITGKLHVWRPVIVFLFGLLHGLGFASVLAELGLPEGRFTAGLVGFNIGVEIGQLTVIALCFLAVGFWFRNKPWYRSRITIPASLVVAAIGTWWFLERTVLA